MNNVSETKGIFLFEHIVKILIIIFILPIIAIVRPFWLYRIFKVNMFHTRILYNDHSALLVRQILKDYGFVSGNGLFRSERFKDYIFENGRGYVTIAFADKSQTTMFMLKLGDSINMIAEGRGAIIDNDADYE